jgi:eukaryotic-like serine/threonine-protein kinase
VAEPTDTPTPTHVGPYRLLERIAVGGMAEVYRASLAQRAGDARSVVVKRMLPRIASDATARAMFAEEARLGAHILQANVVRVFDFGEAESHPYLVLEYVQGVDLWRLTRFLTRTGQAMSTSLAVYIAREMLQGLHAVHEAVDERGQRLGVVHRDVSPSNVLLSVHGEVKLGDLGIARSRLREKFPTASIGERAKGKLGYLAPEQVRGVESDRRADIFSAGVVVAELLMGRPLFAGGSELAVLLAIRDSKIHPFVEFARQLPEGLAEVIIDALAQKAVRRPVNAELFASRLAAFQVEPVDELRRQLAALVLEALDSAPQTVTVSRTPTRTATDPAGAYAAHVADIEESTPIHAVPGLGWAAERTPLPANPFYRFESVHGASIGPLTLAESVQAISTGRIAKTDRVFTGPGPARLASDVAELARHFPSSTTTSASLFPEHDGAKLSGELTQMDDGGIVAQLARAQVERTTALFLCELGGVRKEVYIKDGSPAFVTSNLAGELLGEYLVSKHVISRGELDMALAVMPRFEGRLGDTLSALGLVEPVLLFRHIGEQVRDKLLDLFTWRSGTCTVYHGVAPPPSGFPLNIDGWDVLDEGLARRISLGLESDRLARLRSVRQLPASGPRLSTMRTALPVRLKQLLSSLDAPRTADDLATRRSATEAPEQTLRDVVLLDYLGALRGA